MSIGSEYRVETITTDKATVSLPPETAHRGNLRLLEERLTAFFCSGRCPGELILRNTTSPGPCGTPGRL